MQTGHHSREHAHEYARQKASQIKDESMLDKQKIKENLHALVRYSTAKIAQAKQEIEKVVKAKTFETTIEFTGQADNDLLVAELIDNLGQSPLFKQVNLVFSEDYENNKLSEV